MTSISYSPVTIQTSSQSLSSTPGWFGEATLIVHFLRKQAVLDAIAEHVRFARRRFGRVRGDRLCRRALRLRHQRRTDPRSLLRTPASLCLGLHSPFRARALASTLHAQSLFSGFDFRTRRSPAHALP